MCRNDREERKHAGAAVGAGLAEGKAAGEAPLLRLVDVSRTFPPSSIALRHASLEVHAGESVAVTGASGSGKSTLLAIIGLLDRPTDGMVLLDGMDAGHASSRVRNRLRRQYVSFVFQAFHLIDHLTVEENVRYALAIKGITGAQARASAQRALGLVGLADKSDAWPSDLSGGERQRVAIARAVASPPRLLLCDEPTGNLDSANSRLVVDLLHRTTAGDTTLLVVTHDENVARSCHRRLHVTDGIVREGEE